MSEVFEDYVCITSKRIQHMMTSMKYDFMIFQKIKYVLYPHNNYSSKANKFCVICLNKVLYKIVL